MPERRCYTVIVRLTIDEHTDEHLQTVRGIEQEVDSWLTDLRADVERISVLRDAKEKTT